MGKKELLELIEETMKKAHENEKDIYGIYYSTGYPNKMQDARSIKGLPEEVTGILIFTQTHVYTLISNMENDFIDMIYVPRWRIDVNDDNFIGIWGV